MRIKILVIAAFLSGIFTACRKELAPTVSNAAYVRFANGVSLFEPGEAPGSLVMGGSGQPNVAFVIDGKFETDTVSPFGGYQIVLPSARYTTGAQFKFNLPDDLGLTIQTPDGLPIQSGPVVNGLDLSSWVQIPAGRHRVTLFLTKVVSQIATEVHSADLTKKLIDTTIELLPGEIYTLQNYNYDKSAPKKFGLQVVRENLRQYDFSDTSKIYMRFLNMTVGDDLIPEEFDLYVKYRFQKYEQPGVANSRSKDTTTADEYFIGTVNHSRYKGDLETDVPWFSIKRPDILNDISPLGVVRMEPNYIFNYYRKGESAATGATPFYVYNSRLRDNGIFYKIPKGGIVSIQMFNAYSGPQLSLYSYVFKRQASKL